MNCPFCQNEHSRVIDTRKYPTCILRTRLCSACLTTFQTYEELKASVIAVHGDTSSRIVIKIPK